MEVGVLAPCRPPNHVSAHHVHNIRARDLYEVVRRSVHLIGYETMMIGFKTDAQVGTIKMLVWKIMTVRFCSVSHRNAYSGEALGNVYKGSLRASYPCRDNSVHEKDVKAHDADYHTA